MSAALACRPSPGLARLARASRPVRCHASAAAAQHTLYTVPVSNFGARVKLVLAWKGVPESCVRVAHVGELGGLRSDAYRALNPQCKMPLLVLPDGRALPESEVIVGYLLQQFAASGPSLLPAQAEARAFASLAVRLHDVYLGPVQGCMYKEMGAEQRSVQLAELWRQLDILETCLAEGGPFVAGAERSFADAALYPTFCFYTHILPKHFGWTGGAGVFQGRRRLAAWWTAMGADAAAAAVGAEVAAGLQKWEEDGRWAKVGVTEQFAQGALWVPSAAA
jgi:glutathione S-transferase